MGLLRCRLAFISLLCILNVEAFSNGYFPRQRGTDLFHSSRLKVLREPDVSGQKLGHSIVKETDFNKYRPASRDQLELDQEGRLRIEEGPVILDGLLPSTWRFISPSTENKEEGFSSLFLHASHDQGRAQHELTLGNLVSCHKLLACARVNRYWMGPAFGTSAKDIPLDTQFLLVQVTENGPYALILPLVDAGFRATLHASDESNIRVMCYAESGDASVTSDGMLALYVAVGDDPFELLNIGFQQVSEKMGTFKTLRQKVIPASVDDFGWCTWDAFYSKVSPAGIIDGIKSLKEASVPPRNIIIDDGWQTVSPYPSSWTADESETDGQTSIISGVIDSVTGSVAKIATRYYIDKVEHARHGSFHNRLWTFLAKTVLKQGLWNFFDTQTDFARQLDAFEPNFKFENSQNSSEEVNSLGDLVRILKTKHGLKNVYCWHALHGYWRGITSELGNSIGIDVTQAYPKASDHMLQLEPQMAFDPPTLFGVGIIEDEADIKSFYRHLHEPLVKAGIDGVKVDVQSGVSAAGSGVGGGPHLARIYTEAMEESVSENFASENQGAVNCINCMCHSTENLYRYKVTAVARASEDFFPNRPESHSVHLVNVAYNSLFLGEICLPDWDMFHSKHESAELHAAARAIGGCPVYVSDVPGQHDVSLLKKLVLPDGSILRGQLPGRPTRDCLFKDVGQDKVSALKIWNQNKAGIGCCGAFHVQGVSWDFEKHRNEVIDANPAPLTASVKPYDVETLRHQEGPFAVWRHRASSLEVLEDGEVSVDIDLKHREFEILTISPVQKSEKVNWAPLGLSNMLNSGGAVIQADPFEQSITMTNSTGDGCWRQTTTAGVTSRGPGRFVAYAEPAPSNIILDNGSGDLPSEIPFSHSDGGLLEFDLPAESADGRPHQVTVIWDHTT